MALSTLTPPDGHVYALNAANGAKIWSYTTGNTDSSSPAVVNGVVFVGSYNGNVYALNATTGGNFGITQLAAQLGRPLLLLMAKSM